MKKYVLLFLVFLLGNLFLAAQNLAEHNPSFKVISYNIRYDNPTDGDNSWNNRKNHVINLLRFHDAEIFCLQEALINQVHDLEMAFPGFDYYGPGRDDGQEKGEACPVFFRNDKFFLRGSGTFWYSETPDKPGSIDWGASLPRIAIWVKLKELKTGNEIVVVNTHFDHESQISRNNSALFLKTKLSEIADYLPIIICGDFNARPDSEPFRVMTQHGLRPKLMDAREVSEQAHHGPNFTYIGFDFEGNNGDVIDYIFLTDNFSVLRHAYLTDNRNCIYPSDHLPVLVELKFK